MMYSSKEWSMGVLMLTVYSQVWCTFITGLLLNFYLLTKTCQILWTYAILLSWQRHEFYGGNVKIKWVLAIYICMGDSSPMSFGKGFKRDETVYNVCILIVMDLNDQYESSAFSCSFIYWGNPYYGQISFSVSYNILKLIEKYVYVSNAAQIWPD